MQNRLLFALISSLCLAAGPRVALAQDVRQYIVETDQRIAALERRIEALEREKGARDAQARRVETQQWQDAVADLATTCAKYRGNATEVKQFSECAARRRQKQPVGVECAIPELDELTCH